MAWSAANPANDCLLINAPALIRANWDAIALGTDAALLITNAKVSASAAIVDTKLAQITTAAKVHGTSITGLASLPSGAGVVPDANSNGKLKADSSDTTPQYLDSLIDTGVFQISAGDLLQLKDDGVETVKLKNGSATPGNSKYYGTNSSGTKGFFSLPSNYTADTATDVSGKSWVLDEDDMASDSATKVATQQSIKAYVDAIDIPDVLSNVIFSWSGMKRVNIEVNNSTYETILDFKFKKIAGISTITIYAVIMGSNYSGQNSTLQVDIGGQSNTVSRYSSSWGWATPSDIDVSGLSNGTYYNGTIQLKKDGTTAASKCSAVTLIAS